MEIKVDHQFEIHIQLKSLMQMKSLKDGKEFSIYQLAKAIDMPHSNIVKLIHPDPNKRVVNPRIETLTKIVEFFKSDGFAITIDDLILRKGVIDINSISINQSERIAIEVFLLNDVYKSLGNIDVNISKKSKGLIALLSEKEIKPFFKSGSVFIVDTTVSLKEENLIAVRTESKPEVHIMKFIEKNNQNYLSALTGGEKIPFTPISHHILGVVVQVNAIT